MTKPVDSERVHRMTERRERRPSPEALAPVCDAWAGMERAIQAHDLAMAAAALWLVCRRLEEAWLEAHEADEEGAALLYLDAAGRMADWLDGSPGVEAHRIAESRATCLRLQLASLQAIGNA